MHCIGNDLNIEGYYYTNDLYIDKDFVSNNNDAKSNNTWFSIENQWFDFIDFIFSKWSCREPNKENAQWKENNEPQIQHNTYYFYFC